MVSANPTLLSCFQDGGINPDTMLHLIHKGRLERQTPLFPVVVVLFMIVLNRVLLCVKYTGMIQSYLKMLINAVAGNGELRRSPLD